MLPTFMSPRSRRYRDLPRDSVAIDSPTLCPRPIPRDWTKRVRNRISKAFDRGFEVIPQRDPEVEQLEKELKQLRDATEQLTGEGQQWDEEIKRIKEDLDEMEQRRKMFGETMKKLTLAQRFLSTADSLSQAEIIRALETINEEIFQLASVVADTIKVEQKGHIHQEMKKKYLLRVSPALGPAFLDFVLPKVLEDVLAMQIGWQAILVVWCSEVIRMWLAEGPWDANHYLHEMYQLLTNSNDQAVAGRWRAITRAATEKVSQFDRERLVRDVVEKLTALPILCGYITKRRPYEDLYNAFYQRLWPLLDKCLEFRKVLGEGVTSTNIWPYSTNSGDPYQPDYMDLEYEDDSEESNTLRVEKQGAVACSLTLGLFHSKKSKEPNGEYSVVQETILKPKVILQSTLTQVL